jgi:hypothetical protein
MGNQVRVRDRSKTHKNHTVREPGIQLGDHTQGKPGLANAPGTGKRQKRHIVTEKQLTDRGRFSLAPNEWSPR